MGRLTKGISSSSRDIDQKRQQHVLKHQLQQK
jgi:hypothetical protein